MEKTGMQMLVAKQRIDAVQKCIDELQKENDQLHTKVKQLQEQQYTADSALLDKAAAEDEASALRAEVKRLNSILYNTHYQLEVSGFEDIIEAAARVRYERDLALATVEAVRDYIDKNKDNDTWGVKYVYTKDLYKILNSKDGEHG